MDAKKNRMRRGSKLSQPSVENAVCLEEQEFKQTFSKRDRAIKGVIINLFYPALLAVALYNLGSYLAKDLSLMFQYGCLMFVLMIGHFCLNYLFLYKNSSYYNIPDADGWGWLLFVADIGIVFLFIQLSFSILNQDIVPNDVLSSMLSAKFVKIYALLLFWEVLRDEIIQISNPNRGARLKRLLKNPYLRHMLAGVILFYSLSANWFLFALAFALLLLHYLFLIIMDMRQKLVIA
jgi:hypothetical protein